MKKFALIIAVATTCLSSKAQKVDLDPFNFTFEFRNLPHIPLDSTFKNYSVLVDVSGNVQRSMTADVIEARIVLQGYERRSSQGDLRIDMSINDLLIDKNQVIESSTETKNKDGSVTKNYSYYVSVDYSIGGSASFRDKNGAELAQSMSLFSSRTFNWASSSYKSRSEAQNYFNNNKTAIINKLVRERLDEAIAAVNAKLNYNFGFPITQINSYLWLSDSKKHPETEQMNQRWMALKPVLQGITANQLTEDAKSKIQVMISYFDELKTKYVADDKADKKLRYAAYYNNAVLYLLMDMPDKAITEAQGLVANDYDKKDGEKLAKEAEELMALFNLNGIRSRHFLR